MIFICVFVGSKCHSLNQKFSTFLFALPGFQNIVLASKINLKKWPRGVDLCCLIKNQGS